MKKNLILVRKWLIICIAGFMYAIALSFFLTDNHIAAGGLSGIAIILRSFFHFGIGKMIFIMNIPILISSIVINGWSYTKDTIIATFLYSVMIELTSVFPLITRELFVAASFGGVFYGVGMALLTISNASLGGTDLLCRLINKKCPFVSVPKLSLLIDGSIVLLSMLLRGDVEIGLYAIITIFVCSVFSDKIIYGVAKGSVCMIVTASEPQKIAEPLMKLTGRAVTKWKGNGMYTGEKRNILFMAIKPKEVYKVKRILTRIDPFAFVIVITANELIGGNFNKLLLDNMDS